MRWIKLFIPALVIFLAITFLSSTANATSFNPGRIIDDSIFTDHTSMSLSQVEKFIQSKNSNCTNGEAPCLRNYKENGKTSAQIIYDASQRYKINPQVLLATLQKEVGLLTQNTPGKWRYTTAMGYGCPDSTPGVCESSYHGFTNQMDWAGKMFRSIMNRSQTWYTPYLIGSNEILWHPDAGRCGSSNVNIQNLATVALYSYTPYRPNNAALQAGYGTGNSCSSYGNRNFWLYFNDWFGPTLEQDSPFFAVDGKVHMKGVGNTYYEVPNQRILDVYWNNTSYKNKLWYTNSSYLDGKKNLGKLNPVSRFADSNDIYAVTSKGIYKFQNESDYYSYGYKFGDEAALPSSMKSQYALAGNLTTTVRVDGKSTIYSIENGTRRHISNDKAYGTLGSPTYSSRPITVLPSLYLNTINAGSPILVDDQIIYSSDTKEHYHFIDNKLSKVDPAIGSTLNIKPSYTSTSMSINKISSGNPIGNTKHIKNILTNSYYVIDAGKLYLLTDDLLQHYGLQQDKFTPLHSILFTNSKSEKLKPLVQMKSKKEVYMPLNGELRHIYSGTDLYKSGYTFSDITILNNNPSSIFNLPISKVKLFAEGRVIQPTNSSKIYAIDSNNTMRHFTDGSTLYSYGHKFSDADTVSSAAISGYSIAQPISRFIKDQSGSLSVIDNGCSYKYTQQSTKDAYLIDSSRFTLSNPKLLSQVKKCDELKTLIKDPKKPEVYLIQNGKKRWIKTESKLFNLGFNYNMVQSVSSGFVSSIKNGPSL